MEINKKKILEQLELIVSDKYFSRSKINRRLLPFLVHSSLEGRELKEVVIGSELFGSNYDPIKYDNKVRVYVYHLRKKLEEYYRQNAQVGDIIFEIEKGQYNVKFSVMKGNSVKNKLNKRIILASSFAMLILLLIALLAYFSNKKDSNFFWHSTLESNYPTTVLFGDFFTIEGPISTGESGVTRDYTINSELELEQYLEKHPEHTGKMKPSNHPYLGGHVPFCSKKISRLFFENNTAYEVNILRDWDEAKLKQENIVFFGSVKNFGTLGKIIRNTYPQYQLESGKIRRMEERDTTTYENRSYFHNKMIDITVAGKITNPGGTQMSFFLSDQDCGVISATQYFTNADSTQAFYERHSLTEDDDFIAIFEVIAYKRKEYQIKFKALNKRE